MTTKPLNQLQVGDRVTAMLPADDPRDEMNPVTFDRTFEVLRIEQYKGETVMVVGEGGRFWFCNHPVQRLAVLADD